VHALVNLALSDGGRIVNESFDIRQAGAGTEQSVLPRPQSAARVTRWSGLSTLGALASVFAGLVCSQAAVAEERGFGSWIAACDNTHRCTLLSTQDQAYVYLVRDAGETTTRILGAMSVDIADVDTRDLELSVAEPGLNLVLSYADTSSGVVRAGSSEGVALASALSAASTGTSFVLRSGDAGQIDFSADGFADAWNWMGERQKTPVPAPTLFVSKAKQKPLPKKPPAALEDAWSASCKADGAKKGDWGRLRVSERTTVWRLSCGSYQRLFAYNERTGKPELLHLPYPQPAGEVMPLWRFDATLSLNPGVLGVTAYHLTDCRNSRGQLGFVGRWRWTGSGFGLESFSRFSDANLAGHDGRKCVPHEDWPSIYRASAP
jgi:hypothetical protein